ncbi:N(4)-(beta-N-acetylglucosaminyl)-L-asparaginase [Constantimarinum furrinae]|uniref:N4-(Beta-N-acetylglucosaminyl)-L-asparaginase n=1 Tax=Constantimarinum furrinae TaxID=2562285 RepID=A0A7G8PTV4_9FLAO|nr:N(4)-(beta-N-acetylglucosaminyl)-L-asparaginase [Constantimarinum furrinae]QNJ97770.1 N4-(beta-N-acetylglucosaminyl)-L-asparaginase [Constantimarinum furrinae]
MKRRKFIQSASLTGLGVVATTALIGCKEEPSEENNAMIPGATSNIPLVIATWNVPESTAKAWEVIQEGKSALDAVEQGCMVEEANAEGQSVGIGGLPDRDGRVTLDACIMNKEGNYGAVVCMQHIIHPISVARKVMEDTPHVILAGTGAEEFAVSLGFKRTDLLTETSKKAWEEWKKTSEYKPIINIENHDTIGMLAIDKNGDISGGCTTSGLAYKMAGRVGDSAIIGSGLFIDNEVGGATATGLGEEVLKTVGSFLIVELMRQGKTPQQACEEAIARIIKKSPNYKDFQVGYIAVNKKGETGFYGIHEGFSVTTYKNGKNTNIPSDFYNKG